MKWYTVFNSRTKFSDYRNIAPLPKMSDPAAKAFRNQRLQAQNGNIDDAVHVTVTPVDVLIFHIVLTDAKDQYGRNIRCAEGLYGVTDDIRREWDDVVALAVGLWNQKGNWYTRVVKEETVSVLKPEEAVQLILASPEKVIQGNRLPNDLIHFTDAIGSFTIDADGIHKGDHEVFLGRTQWYPTQGKQQYRIICYIAKTEKEAWLEAVDCDGNRDCLVQSMKIPQTRYGFSTAKLEQAAESIREYMSSYGWREAK